MEMLANKTTIYLVFGEGEKKTKSKEWNFFFFKYWKVQLGTNLGKWFFFPF